MTLHDLILTMPGYVDTTDPTDGAVDTFLRSEAYRTQIADRATLVDHLDSIGVLSVIQSDAAAAVRTLNASGTPTAKQNAALAAATAIQSARDDGIQIDFAKAHHKAKMDNLVAVGTMTQGQLDTMLVGDSTTPAIFPVTVVQMWRTADDISGSNPPTLQRISEVRP